MIPYRHGTWGVLFVFRIYGSVFPKALAWAAPSAALAAAFSVLKEWSGYKDETTTAGTSAMAVGAFVSILGFMVVFRSNQAWSRYWEGAGLIQQVRGQWFNAASSLIAFCSTKPELAKEVERFQNLTVRLMSLLFACALTRLSDTAHAADFHVLDLAGFDEDALAFLEGDAERDLKIEVILQWIQRTIVDNIETGVLPIAPPILSRVFNDLSGGIVNINNARKINDLPFPFHYAQMLAVMLMFYAIGVPSMAAYMMETWWGSAASTFLNVFVLWSVNYLAVEIESPFGDQANDLPLHEEIRHMNVRLKMLLKKSAQTPPAFEMQGGKGRESVAYNSFGVQEFSRRANLRRNTGKLTLSLSSSEDLGGGGKSPPPPVVDDASGGATWPPPTLSIPGKGVGRASTAPPGLLAARAKLSREVAEGGRRPAEPRTDGGGGGGGGGGGEVPGAVGVPDLGAEEPAARQGMLLLASERGPGKQDPEHGPGRLNPERVPGRADLERGDSQPDPQRAAWVTAGAPRAPHSEVGASKGYHGAHWVGPASQGGGSAVAWQSDGGSRQPGAVPSPVVGWRYQARPKTPGLVM